MGGEIHNDAPKERCLTTSMRGIQAKRAFGVKKGLHTKGSRKKKREKKKGKGIYKPLRVKFLATK